MITLPMRVKATFLKLKKENSKYIEIKHIKNYFFVYQSTSRWDKNKRKPVKVPLYLGRITNKGEFIPAKRKKPRNLNNAVQGNMQQTEFDKDQPTLGQSLRNEKKYKHEATLLTALSMNGRMPMSVLGRMVGLKETAVASQIRKLERRYGITYMAEIDPSKLGYIQFLITVKFIDKFPASSELKEILEKEARVQLAFITTGEFDLIMYALAKDSEEINMIVLGLRTKLNYEAVWNAAPVFNDYGYLPIRTEFIDFLKNNLLEREHAVLKGLIKDGKMDFTEIDKVNGFDTGRSQYSYYRLKEKGVVIRITISMHNLPIKYVAIILEDIINWREFKANRDRSLRDIVEKNATQINKYLLVDDTVSPSGSVLYLPVFNEGDLDATVDSISSLNLGIKIKTLIITSIILGMFCFRSFDNDYSIQHGILVKEYKDMATPKIDYEQTGRIKKKRITHTDIRGLRPES
ncbi:MAG: Lrp/AsnC family transcriptional regulator [Candidatus Micrarchaeaceae archaeon]